MENNTIYLLKSRAVQYTVITFLSLLPIHIFLYWNLINYYIPGSDSANYLEVMFIKLNYVQQDTSIVGLVNAIYNIRDWKPVSYPNLLLVGALAAQYPSSIILVSKVLFFLLNQAIFYLVIKKYTTTFIALLASLVLILNPYYFTLSTLLYPDYLIPPIILLTVHFVVKYFENKHLSHLYISLILAAVAVSLRPVESLFFLGILVFIACFFYRSQIVEINKYLFLYLSFFIYLISLIYFQIKSNEQANFITSPFFVLFLTVVLGLFVLKDKPTEFVNFFLMYGTFVGLLSYVWFGDYTRQTWNWINYTSIGNRVIKSDQTFKDNESLAVLLRIFSEYQSSLLSVAMILILLFVILTRSKANILSSPELQILGLIISLILFFSVVYYYTQTGDARRLIVLQILFFIFFIIVLYSKNYRKLVLFFLIVLSIHHIHQISSSLANQTSFKDPSNLEFAVLTGRFLSGDPNFLAVEVLTTSEKLRDTKIAFLSANAVSPRDDSYILDPATTRMLLVYKESNVFIWYTVASNIDQYYSQLKTEKYDYVLMDPLLPTVKPPASNYFMHSNYEIIDSIQQPRKNQDLFVFEENLQIGEHSLILYRIN